MPSSRVAKFRVRLIGPSQAVSFDELDPDFSVFANDLRASKFKFSLFNTLEFMAVLRRKIILQADWVAQ